MKKLALHILICNFKKYNKILIITIYLDDIIYNSFNISLCFNNL